MFQGQMAPVGLILGVVVLIVGAVLLVGAQDFFTQIGKAMAL